MKRKKQRFLVEESDKNLTKGLHEGEKEISTRRERFIEETGTTKAVHLTLITTRGLAHNSHSDIFQNVVVAESLFEK